MAGAGYTLARCRDGPELVSTFLEAQAGKVAKRQLISVLSGRSRRKAGCSEMNRETRQATQELYEKRAAEIVAQMSLGEQVHLMGGDISMLKMVWDFVVLRHYNKEPYPAGGNDRLGVPAMQFCDGPRGLVSGHATCFPVAMARGASFDTDMEERIGQAIGREIRATGGNYFGGVCINLLRHPAGGRAQETFGEDPYHIGQMGAALVRGVQKHNVLACVKHFALNNQENTRFKIDVECDERTLREVYLPHFRDCIDAGAASVMGAYNKFRGEHLCHNSYLLRTILKEEWGFSGFVISDFMLGVRDTVAAARAGLDIEMPSTRLYGNKLVKAVSEGRVKRDAVDEAARRIVATILQFTEAPDPQESYDESLIVCQEHVALAREAAVKSVVLLKNEGDVLPLERDRIKRLAVIGQLADSANIGDHGSSRVHPPYVVTPMAGLKAYLEPGVKVLYSSGKNIEEAATVASMADAALCVVGYTHSDEGEYVNELLNIGGDRDELGLHAEDVKLVKAVAKISAKTAVVLVGGSAIMMEEWREGVPAILHAFYGGMEGGTALARILFGEVNPGGKLPFSIPAYEDHLPAFDKKAIKAEYDLYHGYTKLEKEGHAPAFAFGFGLSYTTFSLANASFSVQGDQVEAAVDVTNTGQQAGDQVVQFYVGFENSAVDRPNKLLRGFERVSLEPGQRKRVATGCPLDKLRWYNPKSGQWQLEEIEYKAYIGSSSRAEDLLIGAFRLPGS